MKYLVFVLIMLVGCKEKHEKIVVGPLSGFFSTGTVQPLPEGIIKWNHISVVGPRQDLMVDTLGWHLTIGDSTYLYTRGCRPIDTIIHKTGETGDTLMIIIR